MWQHSTFTVFTIIRKVYGFSPAFIEHVCDNQTAISATWKDENISVFDKTKPDADVAKLAKNGIADLQLNGHPFSPQEELNILTDGLSGKAQNLLPTDIKPRTDCLHFPEQHVSIVSQQRKVTSRLPRNISNSIHGPKLMKYLSEKEKWHPSVFRSIAWDSFSIAFNKRTTARPIVTTKTMYSFWCTNTRHRRDRGQRKECCGCGRADKDWRHVLVCRGTGAIIFRNGSWAQLRTNMNNWKIHKDIWQ
jgi:hypothetical protein